MTISLPRILLLASSIAIISCKNNTTQKNGMIVHQAEIAYEIQAALGEGAIWNNKTQEFYWVDIEGKTFNIYNPSSNSNKVIETPSRPGTVVPFTETEVIVGLEDGVHSLNTYTGKTTLITNMSTELEGSRLNDGKCDPSGRLWVGSMHFNQIKGAAKLFMINSEGKYTVKKDSVTISNGIVWTADKKTMYYIDTPTAEIKAYDYDEATGNISNERIAVTIPEELGFPDGMTIDVNDKLWVGMWNGNAVLRFDPNNGKLMEKVEVPAHNVTACAFGGENLDTLYITTASLDMTEEEKKQYPLSGSVFKVVPGVRGVNANFFRQ